MGTLEREKIEAEIRALDQLMKANDYIGIKIAMGRATKEEYADEIAQSEAWARRKSELQAKLNGSEEEAEEQPEETEESEEQPDETEEQPEETEEGSEAQPEESEEGSGTQPEESEEPAGDQEEGVSNGS